MKQDDRQDEPLWKALDAFDGVEPSPQSRARFWNIIARDEAGVISRGEDVKERSFGGWRWMVRYVLPATGLACALAAILIGGNALIEQRRADREIAENMELYENYDVIRNMAQLAAYETTEAESQSGREAEIDFDPFEVME